MGQEVGLTLGGDIWRSPKLCAILCHSWGPAEAQQIMQHKQPINTFLFHINIIDQIAALFGTPF